MVILGLHWLDLVVTFDLTLVSLGSDSGHRRIRSCWLRITCVQLYSCMLTCCVITAYVCVTSVICGNKVLVVTFYVQSVLII